MTVLNTTPFKNPHFNNSDRPVYELGHLLRELSSDLAPADLNCEKRLVVEAAKKHASNGVSASFSHIQCLGDLLFAAAGNETNELSPNCLQDLGYLVKSIADQGQFMTETEDRMRYLLGEYDEWLDAKLKEMPDPLPSPAGLTAA